MTAISVTFSPKVAVDWDPQKPLTTTKLNGLVDNTTHLREWMGASYYAGAIQDHNHDGSNSAAIPVGPNYLRNGSFESGLSGWTATPSASGTVALNATAAYVFDGLQSLAITSTVLADGGGAAETNEYVPCSEGQGYGLIGDVLASVAGVSGKVEVEWYDITQALISASTAYTSNSIPTAFTKFGGFVTAPANARFMRILCTGGIPATGTAVGTVYFDGLVLRVAQVAAAGTTKNNNISGTCSVSALTEFINFRINQSGYYRTNFTIGTPSNPAAVAGGRIYRNGSAYGTLRSVSSSGTNYSEDLYFDVGDTVQFFFSANSTTTYPNQYSNCWVGWNGTIKPTNPPLNIITGLR